MSSPARGAIWRVLLSTGCGDFTGAPPSTEMAIRATSTAISAAKASDTNLGPLPWIRVSHSCVRGSTMCLVSGHGDR
jgi:hypothetical protein